MNDTDRARRAAQALFPHWSGRTRWEAIPQDIRPATRADGYAVQRELGALTGQPVSGWKIAATSIEGQRHIGVDGPLAGPIYRDRVVDRPASVSLTGNLMRVAEIEFAFRFGRPLAPRAQPYGVEEVLDAVESVHPSIEVPDSRYEDFVTVGAPQLIADNACANLFVLGPAATQWRDFDFIHQEIPVQRDGQPQDSGYGRNVLGDPRVALTWIINELSGLGITMQAGQFVTTGTCRAPLPVEPGHTVSADFGPLGRIDCRFE